MELALIFLPLFASITSGFFGKYLGDRNSEIITSLFVSISAILSIILFYQVIINGYENNVVVATWINSGTLDVNWSIKVDALSSVMLVVVTLVSAMSLAIDKEITNTHAIGYVLYTDYIHIFQLSGMVLLVAMIGAIVLTFRQRSGVKRQSYFSQISRERTDGVELIDVKSNKGVKSDD